MDSEGEHLPAAARRATYFIWRRMYGVPSRSKGVDIRQVRRRQPVRAFSMGFNGLLAAKLAEGSL